MNIILRHAIKIHGSRESVYRALTSIDEMAVWHYGTPEGSIAVDSIMALTPKPGLKFSWKTKELINNQRIVQTCVEGPGNSKGRTLTFELSDADDGSTVVQLTNGEWVDDDEHLPFCNTNWGGVLCRLKQYIEG